MDTFRMIGALPIALIVAGVVFKSRLLSTAGIVWAVVNALLGTREVHGTVTVGDDVSVTYPGWSSGYTGTQSTTGTVDD